MTTRKITHECDFCGGYVETEEQKGDVALPDQTYAALRIKTKDGVLHKWCEDCLCNALTKATKKPRKKKGE